MRDRLLYLAVGVAFILVIWLIISRWLDVPSLLKAIITTILVITCVGVVFASRVLMNLKRNPEAYNWMDPDLKLTRRQEQKKSKENYFAYDEAKRELIVNDYREARARGEVINKDSWARSKYNISGKTLKDYEDEFPKKET
jgi:glucan phosphoethanolaminetransferase (alkaline phosphatase superfamily)